MTKRISSLIIALAIIVGAFPVNCFAEKEEKSSHSLRESIILAVNAPNCYINGVKQSVGDVVPTVINGRTLVPARFLSESLGGSADWDSQSRVASLVCNGNEIKVPIGEDYINVNGTKKQLDVNSTIINDRTMLPLRGICEAVGKKVDYYDGLIIIHDGLDEDEDFEQKKGMLLNSIMGHDGYSNVGGVANSRTKKIRITEVDVPLHSTALSSVGGMYMENLNIIEKDKDNYTVMFDVYNPHYTYGIVEIYDKDGNLKKYYKIDPYEGLGTGLGNYATSFAEVCKGLYYGFKDNDWDYFLVKNETMSEHTHINCTVPKDGSFFITANHTESDILAAYNTAYSLLRLATTAKNVVPGEKSDPKLIDEIEEGLVDDLVEAIWSYGTAGTELVHNFTKAAMSGVDMFDVKGSITAITDSFVNACVESDIKDVVTLLFKMLGGEKAFTDSMEGATLTAIRNLIPVIDAPLEFWEISDSVSVLTCLFMDLNTASFSSNVQFAFEDTVKYFYRDFEGKNFDSWKDIGSNTNLQWNLIHSSYDIKTHIKTEHSRHYGSLGDFHVDLDGDGIAETISMWKEEGIGLNGYCQMYVYINGIEGVCIGGGSSENPNIMFLATCDIDIEDGCYELIVGYDSGDGFYGYATVRYSAGTASYLRWEDKNGYEGSYNSFNRGIDFDTIKLSSYGNGEFSVRYTYHEVKKGSTLTRDTMQKYKESYRYSREMKLVG